MREKKIIWSMVWDLLLLVVAIFSALILRWEIVSFKLSGDVLTFGIISIIGLIIGFYFCGLYYRIWQYAGISDFLHIIFAVTGGTVILFIATLLVIPDFSVQVIPTLWFTAIILLGGVRFIQRLRWHWLTKTKLDKNNKKALIIGAGEAGALIVRTLQSSKTSIGIKPVGFIDDSTDKIGLKLYGLPVIGTRNDILRVVEIFDIDEVIFAIPSASPAEIRAIANICLQAGVKIKSLPSVLDLIQGKNLLNQLRELRMEDLLHRSEVDANIKQFASYLGNKTILVTGAGGSIGSELCRQICSFQPQKLILLGRGENSIHEIMGELAHDYPSIKCIPVIADIRDQEKLSVVFNRYKPTVVFHAAAHKHVDLMEEHRDEAFKNNVFGTLNVARMADRFHTNTFVLISTDKAVNPSSVMGLTKLLAEMLIRHYAGFSSTKFLAVRFGNVLGSRGSVVNLFRKQIDSGGPVTVTHPEMRRYFMTIREATQLVIQAGGIAKGGEIFILDMGEQVKIVELAKDMIRLSGLCAGKDIDIKFVGIRPGEKLEEELLTEKEKVASTQHQKIFVVETGEIDQRLVRLISLVQGFPTPGQLEDIMNLALNKFDLK